MNHCIPSILKNLPIDLTKTAAIMAVTGKTLLKSTAGRSDGHKPHAPHYANTIAGENPGIWDVRDVAPGVVYWRKCDASISLVPFRTPA